MSEEKDILNIWKEWIKTESKHGDKVQACRNASTVYTTFQNAQKHEKLNDLTDCERRAFEELMKILDTRKEAIQKLLEQYAQ